MHYHDDDRLIWIDLRVRVYPKAMHHFGAA